MESIVWLNKYQKIKIIFLLEMELNNKMSWDNISIKQYLLLNDVINSDFDDPEKMIQIANIVYDCDVTELPLVEYNQKIKDLSFINTPPENARLNKNYVINGTKYISNANIENIQAN